MKICPVGAQLFHVNRKTDMTKISLVLQLCKHIEKLAMIEFLVAKIFYTQAAVKVYCDAAANMSTDTGKMRWEKQICMINHTVMLDKICSDSNITMSDLYSTHTNSSIMIISE